MLGRELTVPCLANSEQICLSFLVKIDFNCLDISQYFIVKKVLAEVTQYNHWNTVEPEVIWPSDYEIHAYSVVWWKLLPLNICILDS